MKTFKILAAAAAIALPLQFAQAEDATVNAQLVLPDVDQMSGGMGIAIGYEVPMPDVNPNFSVEGEFTTTISSPDRSESVFGTTITGEVSYFTLAAYAKYNHPVNEQLDVFGRAGLLYSNSEVSYSCSGTFCGSIPMPGSDSETDTGLSFGFGMNYGINEQMDFTAGYTVITDDATHLSAGIKYKL